MNDILNEKWIKALPNKVVPIFQEISNDIVNIICKRINSIGKLSRTDVIKLTNAYEYLGADFNKIEKIIKSKTGLAQKEIDNLFKEVAQKNDEFAKVFYEHKGISPITYLNNAFLSSTVKVITEQTKGLYTNLSNTEMIGFKFGDNVLPIRDAYIKVVDKAILEVQSGTSDYYSSMRKVVNDLGGGMQQLSWESGYHRRLDSSVKMNLLDGIRQLNQKAMEYHGEQYGADGVELSAHAISAPDHAPLQGRQYSKQDFDKMQHQMPFKDVNDKEYNAIERPIGELNCKHFAFPIVLGISKPFYTEEQLKDIENNSAEKYDKTQKMRTFELRLRKLKNEQMAFESAGDMNTAREYQRKINKTSKAYKGYCEKYGLTPQTRNASVSGYRRIKT